MKKIISIALVMLLLLSCTACGSKDATDGKEPAAEKTSVNLGDSKDNTEPNKDSTKPITVSDVKNHAVSPESDFSCIENAAGGLSILAYLGSDDIVVVPETINGKPVLKIDDRVFAEKPIKGIKLADSVETIGYISFAFCSNLEVVICGSGLKSIGEAAFQACGSLREVELNEGLESIGTVAFSMNVSLKEIVIPSSVTTIDGSFMMVSKDFKIIGKAGSAAEAYAAEASIPFEAQ